MKSLAPPPSKALLDAIVSRSRANNGFISWDDAEQLFPGCTAQWDAQKLVEPDIEINLFINGLDTLSVCTSPHPTRIWWYALTGKWVASP